MHKSKVEEKRAHQDKSEKIEYLSHSHTETLSGSSTTSIVNKCYEKSWKKDRIQRNNNYDDDLEREDDEMSQEEEQSQDFDNNEQEDNQSNANEYQQTEESEYVTESANLINPP